MAGYYVTTLKLPMAIFFKLILKEFETLSICFQHFKVVTLPRNGNLLLQEMVCSTATDRHAINYTLPWYLVIVPGSP